MKQIQQPKLQMRVSLMMDRQPLSDKSIIERMWVKNEG